MSRVNGDPVVRDVATVVVKEAVDGTGRRRRARSTYTQLASKPATITVDKRVMDVVNSIRRPCQRVVIVSETEVLLVNRPGYGTPARTEQVA